MPGRIRCQAHELIDGSLAHPTLACLEPRSISPRDRSTGYTRRWLLKNSRRPADVRLVRLGATIDDTESATQPRSGLPRLTAAVFTDLAIYMVGLGVATGLAFPFLVLLLGVSGRQARSGQFFAATVSAGLLVSGLNSLIARGVVGRRLRLLSGRMQLVGETVRRATDTGDWSGCDDDGCMLPVDSRDELGDSAIAFNRLVQALGRSHAVEAATRDLLAVLSRHLELDRLADTALLCLLEHCDLEAGAFLAYVDGTLRVIGATGFRGAGALAESAAVREVMSRSVRARAKRPAQVIVATSCGSKIDALEVISISFQDETIGAVVLASADELSGEASRLLEVFAGACGVALNNALGHALSLRLAGLDPLTSCTNRRRGAELLEQEFARARRAEKSVGVLMLDLDSFKNVNDTYGHLAGDEVLVRAAETAQACLRAADVLVRYGGEEFMAVLPDVDSESLLQIAERIREAVSRETVGSDGDSISVTTSVGAALYPGSATTSNALLREADTALYLAKAQGRDRVILAHVARSVVA